MEETKRGARNSSKDKERLQTIHDYAVENGADCGEGDMEGKAHDGELKALAPDSPTFFCEEVKALDDNGRVGGYLTRFSTANDPDLTGDFFTKDTDFGDSDKLPVLYQHGFDKTVGKRKIGSAKVTRDEIGLWAESQLSLRDDYEKMIFEMAKAGKLGYSSGAAGHTVERVNEGKANWIKQWYMAEASLTPTPAEYRNTVIPIKSLIPSDESMALKDDTKNIPMEGTKMEEKEIKAMLDESTKNLVDTFKTEAEAAATKAVESVLEKLPEVKAKMNVQVTHDEADNEFKNVAEQLRAVKSFEFSGKTDPRLNRIRDLEAKATLGSNEGTPSQGGFLLEPTLVSEFLKPIHETGPFSSMARRMPVGNNSNYGWINGLDETSRATGSRWGGVRGYWLAEGDTKTASQPKFRRINWELHKLAVLQYASDEVLADAAQLNSIIQMSSMEELSFLVNDAILRGTGAGQPKGILNGGALASAVRTNANNIDHDDVLRMINLLLPSSYANAVWFASPDVQPEIDALNFTAGSTGILSPYVSYSENGVTMLRGRPVIYNEFNPTLGSVGDLLLVDMNDYLMWEKAVEAASSIHVQFLTDQEVFRFVYRVDGQPATYTTLTPYQGSTGRSPYVALAATT